MNINNAYDEVMSWVGEPTSWSDASMEYAILLENKLKEANENTMANAIDIFHKEKNNNSSEKMSKQINDIKNIKEDSYFRDSQKKSSMKTFLNKYVFLIIKFIFIMILLLLLFYKTILYRINIFTEKSNFQLQNSVLNKNSG